MSERTTVTDVRAPIDSETRSTPLDALTHSFDPTDSPSQHRLEASGRYRVLAELGRGGMGIVYRAHDAVLGREIAMKVLRPDYSCDAGTSRFVDEALVTSQLQHPAIPAIYDLGFVDGQPFLAMKLVKGETLAEKLRRPDAASDGAPQVPSGGEDRRHAELIAAFEQVCQALAYAHERRIVHRDLKPSNIMVGAFGEVQVMDWGLAKKLVGGSNSPSAESDPVFAGREISTSRQADSDHTAPGSILGTPSCMAPEQAGGESAKMDERVDVFGLGAVLCAILTGQPPYVGDTADAVRLMAVRGDLAEATARLDGSGADPELVDLCKRCLARDPAGRPRDAKAVAMAVAEYRANVETRLLAAEQAVLVAAAKAAEERKRRLVQLALVGSLVALAAGVSFAVWWARDQQAGRVAAASVRADAALKKAETLSARAKDLGVDAWAEAGAGLWREAVASVDVAEEAIATAGDAPAAAAVASRVAAVRQTLADLRRTHDLLLALETAYGLSADFHRLNRETRVSQAYGNAFASAGLPTDGSAEDLAAAIRAQPETLRGPILAALDHWTWCLGSNSIAARLRRAADLTDGDPFRRQVRAAAAAADAGALLRLAQERTGSSLPPMTAIVLGRALTERREPAVAAAVLLASRDRYPADYWLLSELANALWDLPVGPRPETVASLGTPAILPDRWLPASLGPGLPLGGTAARAEAISCLRAALAVRPTSARTHTLLGYCLQEIGDAVSAERCFRTATELDPSQTEAWYDLGILLDRGGVLPEARRCFAKAIECDPHFGMAHFGLGCVFLKGGDSREAEVELRAAIAFNPSNSTAHANLGFILEHRGDVRAAIAEYRLAAAFDPQSSLAQCNWGEAQWWLGELAAAMRSYSRALNRDPGFTLARKNLGLLMYLRGDLTGAAEQYAAVRTFDPVDGEAIGMLACIREQQGDLVTAEAGYRECLRLTPEAAAFAFESNRLRARPTTADALANVLTATFAEHPKWSARQCQKARAAAAVAAARSARVDAPEVRPQDRPGFRRLAIELFENVLRDLVATGIPDGPSELVPTTAYWLADVRLSHVRRPFDLLGLPPDEAAAWTRLWTAVRAARGKYVE